MTKTSTILICAPHKSANARKCSPRQPDARRAAESERVRGHNLYGTGSLHPDGINFPEDLPVHVHGIADAIVRSKTLNEVAGGTTQPGMQVFSANDESYSFASITGMAAQAGREGRPQSFLWPDTRSVRHEYLCALRLRSVGGSERGALKRGEIRKQDTLATHVIGIVRPLPARLNEVSACRRNHAQHVRWILPRFGGDNAPRCNRARGAAIRNANLTMGMTSLDPLNQTRCLMNASERHG